MKYDIIQILSMVLMSLAVVTGIKLIIDSGNVMWLDWMPELWMKIAATLFALVAGILVTGWAHDKAKALGRRD